MSQFNSKLVVEVADNGRTATLVQPLLYTSDSVGKIEVPAGFATDMASVPKLFWNILPPVGRYAEPAVVHDWLYQTQTMPRSMADSVLLEAMKAHGCNWAERWTIYLAVRAFGWAAWKFDSRKINRNQKQ